MANANVSSVTVSPAGLPAMRVDFGDDGKITITSEGSGGDARFLTVTPSGGHYEIAVLHDLPDGSALVLGADGYPVVTET